MSAISTHQDLYVRVPCVPIVPKSNRSFLPSESHLTVHVHHADTIDIIHYHVGFVFRDIVDPFGEATDLVLADPAVPLPEWWNVPINIKTLPASHWI